MNKTIKKLKKDFNKMLTNKLPMFEIESDTVEDEYYIYNIGMDDNSFYTTSYSGGTIKIEFDEYFDYLDYYFEGLFELCLNDIFNYEQTLQVFYPPVGGINKSNKK